MDRYGCGPPVDELSGWMWQYDEDRMLCFVSLTNCRPTKLPTKPTMGLMKTSLLCMTTTSRRKRRTSSSRGWFCYATAGGSVGGVPVAASLVLS